MRQLCASNLLEKIMRTVAKLFAATLAVALASTAISQGQPNYVESAKKLIVEKMEADWTSKVAAAWGESYTSRAGDEVNVTGFGTVTRESDKLEAVFTYDVTIYTMRRLAPKVSYTILRWSNASLDDHYLVNASQVVVRQRLESDLRGELRIDFAQPTINNVSLESRVVDGTGTFSGRGGWISGAFKYTVRFSRKNGAIENVSVTALPSNPGVGPGGRHNAFTEGVAQSHASEYVRSREGSSVQVQFTGPVTHQLVSKSVDRVAGRGQWRRGATFQWADFRYDLQVDIESGKVVAGTVSLTPDTHGTAEDQKFISFGQIAVRRDFRAQSPAQITFLSGTIRSMPFGKKSVTGDFSAGGKRYAYSVVVEASTGRTEQVTITPGR